MIVVLVAYTKNMRACIHYTLYRLRYITLRYITLDYMWNPTPGTRTTDSRGFRCKWIFLHSKIGGRAFTKKCRAWWNRINFNQKVTLFSASKWSSNSTTGNKMGIFQLHEIFKRRCCLKHLQTFLALSPIALWQPMEIRNPREVRGCVDLVRVFMRGTRWCNNILEGFKHQYGRMDEISQTFQIFA